MTMVQYLPGMLLAALILRIGALDGIQWHASGKLDAVLGKLWGPFVDAAETHLPGWALFAVGIQAMTMTMVQYLPGMVLAALILRAGLLDGVHWHASGKMEAVLGKLWGPFVDAAEAHLPGWALFVVGIATILVSFNLIDRVLPQIDSDSTVSKRRTWLTHPWMMFFLGCIVATLTLSVSVALTVLVPLAVKGYVKRDQALPYIMGANITTLADTLVVAMLQKTPVAAQIVLAEAIGVSLVSIGILAFLYGPTKRNVLAFDDWLTADNRRLAGFVGALFAVPILAIGSGLAWTAS